MRRAIFRLLLIAAAILTAVTAASASDPLNGIGLIDYSRKPTFRVGDWAKYRMTGHSELGMTDNYVVTLVIAGEEDFWGDPCFWVETWTDAPGIPPLTTASLMSYEIFGDSSATQRLMLYMRKAISLLNDDGTPQININKPASGILTTRREVKMPVRWTWDTLGVDTVITPRATYKALGIRQKQGTSATSSVGDSSIYTELRETRTSWYVNEVPITHLAREDIETSSSSKSWLIGRSGDVTALNILDKGNGGARLIDFGHDATARVIPEPLRRSLADQAAAERAAARPRATPGKSRASHSVK